MCLGIPGRLVEVYQQNDMPMGKVDFGGILKETCLAYTPEARVDDYVLVHVGFAISRIDEAEAQELFDYFEEIADFEKNMAKRDLPNPRPPNSPPPNP